jgi:hypothetical protein
MQTRIEAQSTEIQEMSSKVDGLKEEKSKINEGNQKEV